METKSEFLDDLESDFYKFQPYSHGNPNKSQEFAQLNSWHESSRALNNAKPDMPPSRVGFPVVSANPTLLSRPNTTQNIGSRGGSSPKRAQSSGSRVRTANSRRGGDENFVKVDMVAMCSQGWNLSHGWFNRPKAVQIKDEVVDSNIKRWADRLAEHRLLKAELNERKKELPSRNSDANILEVHPAEGEFDDLDMNAIDEVDERQNLEDLEDDHRLVTRARWKPYSTPGPKYNLRNPSSGNRLLNKSISVHHSSDSIAKDIRFGVPGERFRYQNKDCVPLADSSRPPPSPAEQQFMIAHFASKRNFVGSIYEKNMSVPGPGTGKYNTLKPFERTSTIVPIQGTNFSPIGSTPKTMREKFEQDKFPRYRPPKPLW